MQVFPSCVSSSSCDVRLSTLDIVILGSNAEFDKRAEPQSHGTDRTTLWSREKNIAATNRPSTLMTVFSCGCLAGGKGVSSKGWDGVGAGSGKER